MKDEREYSNEDPIDFSCLDPGADGQRFESFIRRVKLAATPELLRRQRPYGIWSQIAAWRRQVAAIAGGLAIASVIILALVSRSTVMTEQRALAQAVGVPTTLAPYIYTGNDPAPGVLLTSNWSEK